MTLCINPNCPQPNHSNNDSQSHCSICGAELIIQGRYRVMRLLTNNSGFGLVYEAFERDRPKILKLLKPDHSQHQKAIQLFEQEALVLSRLQHPGVPKIEPAGCFQITPTPEAKPIYCIVMEKIDGPNLSEWMHQQGNHPISEHQALRWLQQLSEVLHLIHQQQYFHRDIKPDNIMLRSSGQLVLVDFGAVREVSYTYFEQLESTGGITRISSVGYSAPEQERGKAVPQSDFYSLGCTFIYLLTGRKPLDPDIYDALTNEFHWRPFAPHISSGLADFIDQLTAFRVIERPPNTLEILARVADLQDANSTLTSHDTASAERLSSSFPSAPPPAPASSSLDPSLDGSATLPPDHTFIESMQSLSAQSRQDERQPVSNADSSIFQRKASSTPSASRAGVKRRSQNFGTTVQPDATQIQAASTQWVLHWLTRIGMGLLFSLGGVLIFWGGRSLYLSAIQTPGNAPEVVKNSELDAPEVSSALSFTATSALDGHTAAINALAISLDQRLLASASDDRTVRLWDLVSGSEMRRLVGHRDRVQAVAISPNGQMVASGGGDTLIKLWNPLTGEAIANLAGHGAPINALAITADGQRLASASADKTIKIWDLTTYSELETLTGHSSFVNALRISPDGTLLASGAADRTIKLWNLATYQNIATLTGHKSFINTLAFSLNGSTVISGGADHQIKIWDALTYEPLHTLEQHTSFVNALAITLDGQHLVSTSADQTIRVWDLPSQSLLTSIPWQNTFVNTVAIRFTGSTWQILAAGRGSHSIRIWNLEKDPIQ
ncbi:MAG: serine/threonine-protein kinase [Cyanobacteria bacterium P01_F01_bin.150]